MWGSAPLPHAPGVTSQSKGGTTVQIPYETEAMEARATGELPQEGGWQFEPKWDGFRCLAFRDGRGTALIAKSGKPLGRYFPELIAALQDLPGGDVVLDGEIVIALDGRLSFDALQQRLHPAASRIAKLSRETPAQIVLFDCLATAADGDLRTAPLPARRAALVRFMAGAGTAPSLLLSPCTASRSEAARWLQAAGAALDGVIAKPLAGPYASGTRAMLKIKPLHSADCVVGGFRTGTGSRTVASLLLGLYDDAGLLNHVGFTSSIPAAERPALTQRLEALVEPPGFTGKAPGGPSRWSTDRSADWQPLRPELVVEVRFDHVTGGRFRHGTALLRWRPDKAPRQCRMEQMDAALPAAPAAILDRTG